MSGGHWMALRTDWGHGRVYLPVWESPWNYLVMDSAKDVRIAELAVDNLVVGNSDVQWFLVATRIARETLFEDGGRKFVWVAQFDTQDWAEAFTESLANTDIPDGWDGKWFKLPQSGDILDITKRKLGEKTS